MARAGLLHVTVITATLVRDAGRSDSDHRANPAWNESYTFKFDERSELESQHILIEIFAEKPKLDELLGLAKIPLQTVITAGDEISTHSLNRPHEEYIGHEQYSGYVKVALKWDSAQRVSAPVYPQTYTPAARYNSNASIAKVHTLSGQTSTSGEQLQAGQSGEKLRRAEDIDLPGQDRGVHHSASFYPYCCQSVGFSAPSFSLSPSKQPLKMEDCSTPRQHPSYGPSPPGHPSSRLTSRNSFFEAPSNAFPLQDHGCGSSPHVPYVSHEGNKAGKGMSFIGPASHAAYVQPIESGPANLYLKPQDDVAKGKLSTSKQAEIMKLAELCRLTEMAKIQATSFAKAGQQRSPRPEQSVVHAHQRSQVSPGPKTDNALLAQLNHVPTKQRNDVSGVQRQAQAHHGLKKKLVQPLPELIHGPQWPNVQSKQLTVVSTMLDIVRLQSPRRQRGENPEELISSSQRRGDVIYEKAIQKAERPEQKQKVSSFRQTLKILRKTSKIFGI